MAPARAVPDRLTRAARRAGKRRLRRALWLAAGAVVIVVAVVVAMELQPGSGPAHAIAAPRQLGAYVQAPNLASSMGASKLKAGIMADGGGEATHVVDAVYEDSTGPAARSGPQIILFIGGNLSGSSAKSFITSFIGQVRGAVTTGAGLLGGAAACAPAPSGGLAECAWADNDTFGLVASPTMSPATLGNELRQLRPQVEHVVK
ncbi:MAG: hypothetical protein ACLPN6_01045 [Streptosporangiaceae bacterium]